MAGFGMGGFGQPAAAPGGFGQPAAPAAGGFGAPAAGGFGAAPGFWQQAAPAAGGFEQPAAAPGGFGQQAAPAAGGFGQPAGGFGQPAAAAGGFGQPAAGGFGQPAAAAGGFGQPAAAAGGFGQPAAGSFGGFGAAPSRHDASPFPRLPLTHRFCQCPQLTKLLAYASDIDFTTLSTKAPYCRACFERAWQNPLMSKRGCQATWKRGDTLLPSSYSKRRTHKELRVEVELFSQRLDATQETVRVTVQTGFPRSQVFQKLIDYLKQCTGNCAAEDPTSVHTELLSTLHKLLDTHFTDEGKYHIDHLDAQPPLLLQRKMVVKKGQATVRPSFIVGTVPYLLSVVKLRLTSLKKLNVHITYSSQTDYERLTEHYLTPGAERRFGNTIQLNVHSGGFVEATPQDPQATLFHYLPVTYDYLTIPGSFWKFYNVGWFPRSVHSLALLEGTRATGSLRDAFFDTMLWPQEIRLSRANLIDGVRHIPCAHMRDAVTFSPSSYRLILAVLMSLRENVAFQRSIRGLTSGKRDDEKIQWSGILGNGLPGSAITVGRLKELGQRNDMVPLSAIWVELRPQPSQEDPELQSQVAIRYIWPKWVFTNSRPKRTHFEWCVRGNAPTYAYVYLGSSGYSAFVQAEMDAKWSDLKERQIIIHNDPDTPSTPPSPVSGVYTALAQPQLSTPMFVRFVRSEFANLKGDVPYHISRRTAYGHEVNDVNAFVCRNGRMCQRLRVAVGDASDKIRNVRLDKLSLLFPNEVLEILP